MRYTLLEMVQQILSSMDGDEVNGWNETTESTQVANIIRTCYNDLVSGMDMPEHNDLFELTASSDILKPTQMTIPSNVIRLDWIKYNVTQSPLTEVTYQDVEPMEFKEFIDRVLRYNEDQTFVGSAVVDVGSGTFLTKFETNRGPQFYTAIDDNTLLFDAYDSDEDTTLVGNKTLCYGRLIPTFTMSDAFTPDLNPQQFTILLNEAKAQAFLELKQTQNMNAERKARKGWIRSQVNRESIPLEYYYRSLPNYGRLGRFR